MRLCGCVGVAVQNDQPERTACERAQTAPGALCNCLQHLIVCAVCVGGCWRGLWLVAECISTHTLDAGQHHTPLGSTTITTASYHTHLSHITNSFACSNTQHIIKHTNLSSPTLFLCGRASSASETILSPKRSQDACLSFCKHCSIVGTAGRERCASEFTLPAC